MGLKEQLEQAGYDTSGLDEASMIQKLNDAGYDTSSLAPAAPKERNIIQKTMDTIKVGQAAMKATGMFTGPQAVRDTFDEWGNKIAETDVGNPTARGLVAGTVANLPDLALMGESAASLKGGFQAPKAYQAVKRFFTRPSPQELRAAMQADVKALGTPATDAVRAQAHEALPPIENKVREAKRAKEGVEGRFRQLEEDATARLDKAKKGLDVVEENANLNQVPFTDPRFQKIVGNTQAMSRWAQRAERIAAEGPIAVSKKLKPERIQLYRKVLQEGREKLSPAAGAKAASARETMSRSLEYGDEFFKSAREEYHAAKNLVDGLKAEKGKSIEAAKAGVAEAGRELTALQQKFRTLTEQARTADVATRSKLQVERLRAIAEAEAFERKLQRNLKIAWAGMGAAGITGLGYKLRQEMRE